MTTNYIIMNDKEYEVFMNLYTYLTEDPNVSDEACQAAEKVMDMIAFED